jgi:hypothetical protein
MAGDGGDEVKSLCDKWCIYRFLDGKERLCKATERYKKTVQPVLQCDKYKRFLDSDAENRLEKEIAAANQRISTMYTEEQMEQFYQDGFNNGQVAAGKRIEQMQRVVDVARIVADCRSGINLKPFAHSHALDAMEKALAELEAK